MSNVLKILRKYKKLIKILIILLVLIIVGLIVFKSLFYSNSQKSIYGVRLRDYEKNKITADAKKDLQKKCTSFEEISSCKIDIKGRLVKYYITFNDDTSNDVIKNKINEILPSLNDLIKEYYDVEFYAIEKKEGKEVYPVIGYKHKFRDSISYDEF